MTNKNNTVQFLNKSWRLLPDPDNTGKEELDVHAQADIGKSSITVSVKIRNNHEAAVNGHLAKAAELANKAIAAASDKEFIGICFYEGPNGRPTRKEYAELNYGSVAIADAICRQRCNMLRAYYLRTEIESARVAGDEKSAQAKVKLYRKLIREDIGVQEDFCELLTSLAGMRPCYTRTSLTEREISNLRVGTKAKIDKLNEFLETK